MIRALFNQYAINRLIKPAYLILLLLAYTSSRADWLKQQQDIMGTRVSVELWHNNLQFAQQCSDKVFEEVHRIDALMSPYKPNSEISFINNNAAISTIEISKEMSTIVKRALFYSQLSEGAFDITFASVGYRYNYREKLQPSDSFISNSLNAIDYHHIQLDKQKIYFDNTGVKIDLGGIAKGYAVDQALQIVADCGIVEAMISAGGDSRILGRKRGKPWMIGIQHPRKKNDVALVLPLSDTAISTSGDYERYFIQEDGYRVHHIINPSTGRSADSSWSATVIGPDAMTTDALSTTIFVLGAEKGIALIETLKNIDAVIIDRHGKVHYSSGLRDPGKNS